MGQLDDAIREHLELKRKHGADEDAVKRELDDALGPARRDLSQPDLAAPAEPTGDDAPPAEPERSPAAAGDFDVEIDEFLAQPGEKVSPEPPEHPRDAIPDRAESWGGSTVFADELRAAEAGAAPPTSESDLDPDLDPPHDEIAAEPPGQGPESEPEPGDTPARGFAAVEDDGVFGGEEPFKDEPAAAEEPGDHDVLEETPEFLQETPEHDRLWFEQKPPRDFDFDEE